MRTIVIWIAMFFVGSLLWHGQSTPTNEFPPPAPACIRATVFHECVESLDAVDYERFASFILHYVTDV